MQTLYILVNKLGKFQVCMLQGCLVWLYSAFMDFSLAFHELHLHLVISILSFVAMFYWMLLNIHPAHRSTLRTIQLLAVVKTSQLKQYGVDAVLEASIRNLQTLGTTVSVVNMYYTYGSTYSRNGPNVPYMQYKMFTFIKLQ